MEYCENHDCLKTIFPIKNFNDILKFKNHQKMQKVSFVIIADFECFIKPINTVQQDPNKSYTNQYQKHEPSGFCYYVKCFDDSLYKQDPILYTMKSDDDDDVSQILVNSIEETVKKIYAKFKDPKKMIFTDDDKENFEKSTHCYICEDELDNDKVRD